MDKILEKTQELKSAIEAKEEYQEFLRLKKLYDSNEEIQSLLIQIKQSDPNSNEHKDLLDQYNNYPLVINYLAAREEVKEILLVIKDILDK